MDILMLIMLVVQKPESPRLDLSFVLDSAQFLGVPRNSR